MVLYTKKLYKAVEPKSSIEKTSRVAFGDVMFITDDAQIKRVNEMNSGSHSFNEDAELVACKIQKHINVKNKLTAIIFKDQKKKTIKLIKRKIPKNVDLNWDKPKPIFTEATLWPEIAKATAQ